MKEKSNFGKGDFARFYEDLHEFRPFPWQQALLERVWEEGEWPEVIDLPTGAGKTSCIDIALYHMAAAEKPKWRRIFFVVDRRIIVSDVAERANKIVQKLEKAKDGLLKDVHARLCELGGGVGLRAVEMRGGIYQDRSWVGNPLQAMIVASTVDQVGSRLLFRGYGIPELTAPIHAAMVAQDSLLFLDEAHCSKAFAETLALVRKYQTWRSEDCGEKLRVVEMTATPSRQIPAERRFTLTAADEDEERTPRLARRLRSAKPTQLKLVPKGKKSFTHALADEAEELSRRSDGGATCVLVNRVKTAREVYEELCKRAGEDKVLLLIGRMRPLDAKGVHEALEPFKTGANRGRGDLRFVVSTQCLEVGADLDFDAMVSECASLDALQQRFGRLDRIGRLQGDALGSILCSASDADSKDEDPIYGNSLKDTWQWLNTIAKAGTVDFGLRPSGSIPNVSYAFEAEADDKKVLLRRKGEDACVLLPAHLDALCQTAPIPHVDPDVSVFLHGQADASADVQVIWRVEVGLAEQEAAKEISNLAKDARWREKLIEALALCPPSNLEALPVRVFDVRAWLRGEEMEAPDADLEGLAVVLPKPRDEKVSEPIRAFRWKGQDSQFILNPREIRPGDTIVVDVSSSQNLAQLGYIPRAGLFENSEKQTEVRDLSDEAAKERGQLRVRVHERLLREVDADAVQQLFQAVNEADGELAALKEAVEGVEGSPNPFAQIKDRIMDCQRSDEYLGGYLARGRVKQKAQDEWLPLEEDSGEDSGSFGPPDTLVGHTGLVYKYAKILSSELAPEFSGAFGVAADWHDVGKADVRFQTLLCAGDRLRAEMLQERQPLAKSAFRRNIRGDLPKGFRHEIASLQFAEELVEIETERDLVLHLIASHHGHVRPFAPFVPDSDAPPIFYQGNQLQRRDKRAAHEIGSGCGERFWSLTRRFGWWGLAYMEAIFRLADWRASRESSREKANAS